MILANQFMRKTDRDNYNLRNLYRDASGQKLGMNKSNPQYNIDVGGDVDTTSGYYINDVYLYPNPVGNIIISADNSIPELI